MGQRDEDQEAEKFLDFINQATSLMVADFFGVKVHKVILSKAKRRKLLVELKGNYSEPQDS